MSSAWNRSQAPGDGHHGRASHVDAFGRIIQWNDGNGRQHNPDLLQQLDTLDNLNPLYMVPVPPQHSPPQYSPPLNIVEGVAPPLDWSHHGTIDPRARFTPAAASNRISSASLPTASTRIAQVPVGAAIPFSRDYQPTASLHAHPSPVAAAQTANGQQRWAVSADNLATFTPPQLQHRPQVSTPRGFASDAANSEFSSNPADENGIDLESFFPLVDDGIMPPRPLDPSVTFANFNVMGESSTSAAAATLQGQARERRRAAIDAASPSRTVPRKRRAHEISQPDDASTRRNSEDKKVESVDLTADAAVAEASLAQTIAQQQESAAARAGVLATKQKLGQLQCIICMEPFTNATTTHCGHVYCHECLTQALLASAKSSESGIGHCPVCRKTVSKRRQNQIVPIAFMKRSAFRGKGRQQQA